MSRRDQAVILLAQGKSVTDVSDSVGVSRQTIYTWMDDEEMQRSIQLEKTRLIRSLSALMIKVTLQALYHLDKVTEGDPEVTMARDVQVRLQADRLVIQKVRDLMEMADLEDRVSRLEERDRYDTRHR